MHGNEIMGEKHTVASSDSLPPGAPPAAANQATQNVVLTAAEVRNIVAQAQTGATDPVTAGMQIFNTLGEDISIPGDVLRQALMSSNVAVTGPLSALLAAVENITKLGTQVTATSRGETQAEIGGTPIRSKQTVTFTVGTEEGCPTLSNITGIAVHKFLWFDITQIQLRQGQGQSILHVVTAAGARDIVLG